MGSKGGIKGKHPFLPPNVGGKKIQDRGQKSGTSQGIGKTPSCCLGHSPRDCTSEHQNDISSCLFRNKPEVPPLAQPWRENNYTWDGPRAWSCFRPNADVLVPMYFTYATADIVSPFAGVLFKTVIIILNVLTCTGCLLVRAYPEF